LADADKPNMDKLYFYVHCLDKCLNKSKELLDMIQEKLYKTSICYKYDSIDGTDNEDEFIVDDCPSEDESGDVMVASPSLGAMMIAIWHKRKEKLIPE